MLVAILHALVQPGPPLPALELLLPLGALRAQPFTPCLCRQFHHSLLGLLHQRAQVHRPALHARNCQEKREIGSAWQNFGHAQNTLWDKLDWKGLSLDQSSSKQDQPRGQIELLKALSRLVLNFPGWVEIALLLHCPYSEKGVCFMQPEPLFLTFASVSHNSMTARV